MNSLNAREKFDFREGLAFAIILSVLGAIASSNADLTPNENILSWLVFIIASGIFMNTKRVSRRIKFFSSFIPAASFIASMLFIFYSQKNPFFGSGISSNEPITVAIWSVIIFLATAIGVFVSINAAKIIITLIKLILGLSSERLTTVEKKINTILRIITAIGACFAIFR